MRPTPSPEPVRAAAADETDRPDVAADRDGGIDRGVEGNPTAFVNDDSLVRPSDDELRAAIETWR